MAHKNKNICASDYELGVSHVFLEKSQFLGIFTLHRLITGTFNKRNKKNSAKLLER